MTSRLLTLALLAALLLGASNALGTPVAAGPDRTLDMAAQAQAAYDRGVELRRTDPAASLEAFRRSAREWQRLVDAGASNGPLYFNLANACMQSGDLGRAIVNYLRAERAMPGDPDLEQNLAQARSAVQHAFARGGSTLLVDSMIRWWHLLPLWLREWGAWFAWFAFWGILLTHLLAPRWLGGTPRRDQARKLALAVTLATWGVLGGTLVADHFLHTMRPRGVLIDPGVVLRKGNGEGFDPAFAESLGPGVEFSIREERPGWWRIELPDGRTGWIKSSQAEQI